MELKSIVFYRDMVEAILEKRKSIFRQPLKPQPVYVGKTGEPINVEWWGYPKDNKNNLMPFGKLSELIPFSPYKIDDTLYVKEAYFHNKEKNDYEYYASTKLPTKIKWQRAINMPFEASRIFLKITSIKVERIEDITLEDIEKEGFFIEHEYEEQKKYYASYWNHQFYKKWSDRFGEKGKYFWDQNPFVYVYSFDFKNKTDVMIDV